MRIVETRQGSARGILLPWDERPLELRRFEPSADLAPFVERHWVLRWNLRSRKHVQRVLGLPCVDLVFGSGEARRVENGLRALSPRYNTTAELAGCIVDRIFAQHTITRAAQLERLMGVRERTLQRMFAAYVGVNPKGVLRRARLQLAADRLRTERALAALAQDLGYFDQAHFDRDFRDLLGVSPGRYRPLT